jgi:hypothetical protein
MKNAFVTFYFTALNNKMVEIHNGFSFVHHMIEGDHFFITTNDDTNKVKEMLKGYDVIYASTSFHPESLYLKDVVDKRWVVGGPSITTKSSLDFWKTILGEAKIINQPFESLLQQQISSRYTTYWDELVEKVDPKFIRMSAICDKRCYWNSCTFCALRFNQADAPSERLFGRDVDTVLRQLPDYPDKIVSCYIACNAVSPMVLSQFINSKYRKPNYVYHFQVRFDREIQMILEQADDLHNFEFGVGLEFPSQSVIDRFNKGLELNVELETLKMASERGAKIQLFMMLDIPFITEEHFREASDNIDWMKKNLVMMDWEGRIFIDDFEHTKDKFFEDKPENIIQKYGGVNIFYSPFVWKTEEAARKDGDFAMIPSAYGNTVYRNILTDRQKELHKQYWENLMSWSKDYATVAHGFLSDYVQ